MQIFRDGAVLGGAKPEAPHTGSASDCARRTPSGRAHAAGRSGAMSENIGRVGADVRHLRHGAAGTRSDRASLLHESMRELDPKAAAYFAAANPNIVAADTHRNIAMVNDGAGGFRRPKSKEEVLAYGDGRINAVHRKISARSFETTLIVIHLPKSMCQEVPDFYPVLDSDGIHQLDKEGRPRMKSRWVARDRDEAIRFFTEALAYYSSEVLTGGSDAIHGYDINTDEATPHVQAMADTFAPDPKHNGSLRVDASRVWGSHPEVRDENGKQIGGSRKMRQYQAGLRQRMHDLGYPVELDADPLRSMSNLGKEEYIETHDRLADIAQGEESLQVGRRRLAMDLQDHRYRDAAVGSLLADAHAKRHQAEAELEQLPELRRKARREGFAAGRSDLAAREADIGRREFAVAQERAQLAQRSEAAERALASARSAQIAAQVRVNHTLADAQARADQIVGDAQARAAAMMPDPAVIAKEVREASPDLWADFLKAVPNAGKAFDAFAFKKHQVRWASSRPLDPKTHGMPHGEAQRKRDVRFQNAVHDARHGASPFDSRGQMPDAKEQE